jgi:hypothetical protein
LHNPARNRILKREKAPAAAREAASAAIDKIKPKEKAGDV